jgi:hypothetical protein
MLNLKVTSSLFSKLAMVIFGQKIYLKSMFSYSTKQHENRMESIPLAYFLLKKRHQILNLFLTFQDIIKALLQTYK